MQNTCLWAASIAFPPLNDRFIQVSILVGITKRKVAKSSLCTRVWWLVIKYDYFEWNLTELQQQERNKVRIHFVNHIHYFLKYKRSCSHENTYHCRQLLLFPELSEGRAFQATRYSTVRTSCASCRTRLMCGFSSSVGKMRIPLTSSMRFWWL